MSNLEKFITSNDLEDLKVCEEGLNYFKINFPNGARIIDVIKKLEKEKTTKACWISWLCEEFKLDYIAKEWYENGQLRSNCNYKDGRRHGLCQEWYENGQLWSSYNYKDDKEHGLCQWWHKSEQLWSSFNYKDGRRHGLCQWWYLSGKLQTSYNYKDGKEHGLCQIWAKNGTLWSSNVYKDGHLIED